MFIDGLTEAALKSLYKRPTLFGQHRLMAFIAPTESVALGESWTFNHSNRVHDSTTSIHSTDSIHICYTLDRIIDSAGVSFAVVSARITSILSTYNGIATIHLNSLGMAEFTVETSTGLVHHARGSNMLKGEMQGEYESKPYVLNSEMVEGYTFCLLWK